MSNLKSPTVSAVIPLYNKGKYIERALSSVLAQTHPPLEIIVVDDGSTDDGPERVLNLRHSIVTLMSQDNKGPGAARNAGLNRARGKYVAFLDADDEWMPSFLKAGLSFLEDEQAKVAVVWTDHLVLPAMKRNDVEIEKLSGVYEFNSTSDPKLLHQIICFAWSGTTIVKTEVARKWDGFYDSYKCLMGEDRYFYLKLLFNEKIGIIPEPHAIYHTDASDLNKNKYFQLPPYVLDPEGLLSYCPISKRHSAKQLLAILALDIAKILAKYGRGKEAKEICSRFLHDEYDYRKGTFYVRLLVKLAPILPTACWFWHRTKLMLPLGRAFR